MTRNFEKKPEKAVTQKPISRIYHFQNDYKSSEVYKSSENFSSRFKAKYQFCKYVTKNLLKI